MANLLPILTHPDPRLRQRAVESDAQSLARLRGEGFLDALVETMRVADGVGIAAIQVGVPHRIIVVREGHRANVYVNPVIASRSIHTVLDIEGCLSVPGIIGIVPRARSVTVRARDAQFQPIERRVRNLTARIFQHEVDHLDGVLFIDRAIQTTEVARGGAAPLV